MTLAGTLAFIATAPIDPIAVEGFLFSILTVMIGGSDDLRT